MMMFCMDDMIPQDHMLRLIDKVLDWTFIYDLVEDKYCMDNGRPRMALVPHEQALWYEDELKKKRLSKTGKLMERNH